MPTMKKRLNVTLKKDTAVYLKKMALRDDVPEATKASELIETALELEEDLHLSHIADQRLDTMKGTIPHKEFWSRARS